METWVELFESRVLVIPDFSLINETFVPLMVKIYYFWGVVTPSSLCIGIIKYMYLKDYLLNKEYVTT